MASLLERCRDQIIPEPIVFVQDAAGTHFATPDQLPWRTVIRVPEGIMFVPGITIAGDSVTISLDGVTAVYRRRGYDISGAWICDLVQE